MNLSFTKTIEHAKSAERLWLGLIGLTISSITGITKSCEIAMNLENQKEWNTKKQSQESKLTQEQCKNTKIDTQ